LCSLTRELLDAVFRLISLTGALFAGAFSFVRLRYAEIQSLADNTLAGTAAWMTTFLATLGRL
jgi:hypothetical protein